ncbi:hypothetical protein ACWC10_00030 [Streptomyces sp. NPDC001595]|uniref:hypothetical protein n=1 Tax=Streptomyces sp. NPDC001532 TaxID=3154520 RepID=UPI003330E8D2
MGGFEVLRDCARHNAAEQEKALEEMADGIQDLGEQGRRRQKGGRRERIPVHMWRALKPSDANGN